MRALCIGSPIKDRRQARLNQLPLMMKYWIVLLLLGGWVRLYSQSDREYQNQKVKVMAQLGPLAPGPFASFVKGVKECIATDEKVIALTFDACGGPGRGGYDEELINFLRVQRIPATLFLSGLWIDEHLTLARQ